MIRVSAVVCTRLPVLHVVGLEQLWRVLVEGFFGVEHSVQLPVLDLDFPCGAVGRFRVVGRDSGDRVADEADVLA